MQPYVICQGDYLAKLAFSMGFDPDVVWNDPANASLRTLRPNPNILFAGDVLYVPEPPAAPAAGQSLAPGSSSTFVSQAPTVPVTICFMEADLASQAFTVQELPALTGLTTGADGTATFDVPVTMATVTIAFTSSGTTFTCNIGNLDPIGTLSGILQRLQHLGYLSLDLDTSPIDPDLLRAGLLALKADQTAEATPPSAPSPPSSQPTTGPSPIGPPDSSPASSSPGAATTTTPSADGTQSTAQPPPSTPAAAPASSPAPSSPAPSAAPSTPPSAPADSQPPPSSDPPESIVDDSGMGDDGTLDAATSALLLQAHGS